MHSRCSQATHNQYKAEAEQRQASLATAAQEARTNQEAAQRVRQEAEQHAQKLQEQLEAEQTAHKVPLTVAHHVCLLTQDALVHVKSSHPLCVADVARLLGLLLIKSSGPAQNSCCTVYIV